MKQNLVQSVKSWYRNNIVPYIGFTADSGDGKQFNRELDDFNKKLQTNEPFSLVRFGDGEMMVINGQAIDLSSKHNGEHKYSPDNTKDEHYRDILESSLLFKHPQYFVGLPCRCCVGNEHCNELREQSKQDEQQLTWANIFVNSNYPRFLSNTVTILKDKKVNMVCHEKSDLSGLPFSVNQDFRVGANAWVDDYDELLLQMTNYLNENNIEGEVFIFCAGVLSNMLIYKLTESFPNNTYIDVGSVFDEMMKLGKTRKYLKGSRKRLRKVCIW
ncbi:GT-D fold domain-containing protein [Thalassotalea agarivorans]|uniref:Uncharacterized protein n=1 Tax=Thalassotalea agarivorans TaxID=349064 RepID=A0A1I0EA57_THASX|nr:hypothetical protein [Thalassotalea agarivorans]SET41275.1 hypothetical protein SAMN05660429_01767 [Thalassotalea agarivorans]